jgi:hypothetical protein
LMACGLWYTKHFAGRNHYSIQSADESLAAALK